MSRLRLSEYRRLAPGGLLGATLFYLFRHILPVPAVKEGALLPQKWKDLVVDPEELTPSCMDSLMPQIAMLERQGFYLAAYQKLKKHLFPNSVDNGGAYLLHPSGDYGASVVLTITRRLPPQTGNVPLLVTCIFTRCISGKVVTVGDSNKMLDPTPPREVVFLRGASVPELWKRIQAIRAELDARGEKPAKVRTVEEMERNFDYEESRTWNERVNVRKLMVRMTDDEIQATRRQMLAHSGQAFDLSDLLPPD